MSLSLLTRKAQVCFSLAFAIPMVAVGQGNYATNGSQYAIAGRMAGDQVRPRVALGSNGGFLVWQDNITDGDGLGVSALRLDRNLAAAFAPFRVNAVGTNDQERAQVSLLNDGGAAFVWQGGVQGFQHIYARFLSPSNTWATGDLLVNSSTTRAQVNPAVATLADGSVVVVYSSINQVGTNSMQDVYGQMFTSAGQKSGGEFLVNQFTPYNQRAASVAPLQGGGFVVVWVSEQQRSGTVDVTIDLTSPEYLYAPTNRASVDICARLYSASGNPAGGEFLVNTANEVCGTPCVAAGSDGGFMVTWSQKTFDVKAYGWDNVARPFSAAGEGGAVVPVNSYLYGDQYSPQIAAMGTDYYIVWTSLAQDGSREGVFGRFLRSTGAPVGSEVLVNTTTIGQQMHPAVASDKTGSFLVAWTGFVGGEDSFDLSAQRWVNVAQPLVAMDAPFVYAPFVMGGGSASAVYQPQLQVSWAMLAGIGVDHYEVYLDGAATQLVSLTTNVWVMTAADGLTSRSEHSFRVAYVAADGRRSPLSPSTIGRTWSGYSWDGIPFEWMQQYYGGMEMTKWPRANSPVAAGGPSLEQVFLSGANPLDSSTWLRTGIVQKPQGYFLVWNPQPGLIYQVQTSLNLSEWGNLGAPRFSAGGPDSIYIGGNNAAYYRVLRLR